MLPTPQRTWLETCKQTRFSSQSLLRILLSIQVTNILVNLNADSNKLNSFSLEFPFLFPHLHSESPFVSVGMWHICKQTALLLAKLTKINSIFYTGGCFVIKQNYNLACFQLPECEVSSARNSTCTRTARKRVHFGLSELLNSNNQI